MNLEKDFKVYILSKLKNNGISFEHISSSADSISVIVKTEELNGKKNAVLNDLYNSYTPEIITIEDNIALIAIVSENNEENEEIIYRAFKSITSISIKTKLIDKGSNDISVIIGIDEFDYVKIINILYSEFTEEKK